MVSTDSTPPPTEVIMASKGGDHFIEKLEAGYGEDHHDAARNAALRAELENPNIHQHMNLKLFLALTAMSFLWVGSQIPLYLYGAVLPLIYSDIGGADGTYLWMVIGYLIPNAALCPFVGNLSDMFGRKSVAVAGQLMLMIGPIIVSTATNINAAIGGMVVCGLGAGLNELISLAGTSELVPVRKRPAYVGAVVATILPFCPSALWAQLVSMQGGWRWNGALIGIWNLVGLILVIFCYKDPLSDVPMRPKKEILAEIDYIGGFLSIAGVVLFMVGMQTGAQDTPWSSAQVLVPFLIGAALIAGFFVWEMKFAKNPMVPAALFSKDKRSMISILLITFFSGGNFLVVLLFWPTQSFNMYGDDPVQDGIRTLPIGFGIIGGAFLALVLIGVTKGRTTIIMIFTTVLMTAFTGAMAGASLDNLNHYVYPILTMSCVGVGAVIIPCSIIAQIVAPTELIGTITAITLSIRYIGGAIAFTAYYNVFYAKFYPLAVIAGAKTAYAGICYDYDSLKHMIEMAGRSQARLLKEFIAESPLVLKKDVAYETIIGFVQEAFTEAYRYPYYISIAFGGVCIVCALFLRDIRKHMEGV
ncbi:putative major facilitator superfamily transporter [Dissoconium aciculare CBS 342.82]|uniref:Major facilitator superfamily transporter n=1 Tax=Dissoconium aciculare CBS 342.82 TaxID=1314786 RepID=A0A6J3LVZ0_9PEZI|nr:putative major facilitator superfamily transporter [Dissoconium aciculare CBS 342.82]KAF1819941.1 putative major facilitator superfamily transporter [Dissoconium aciculare CBS 342.82]